MSHFLYYKRWNDPNPNNCRSNRIDLFQNDRKLARQKMTLRRRILVNESKIIGTESPILMYLNELATCDENSKSIYALLILTGNNNTEKKEIINDLIENGAILVLLQCLNETDNDLLKSNACHIIDNILLFGDQNQVNKLLQYDLIEKISPLLESSDQRQQKYAIIILSRCIQNMDSNEMQSISIETIYSEILLRLKLLLQTNDQSSVYESIIRFLSILAKSIDLDEIVTLEIVPMIKHLFERFTQNEKNLIAILNVLYQLTNGFGCNERIKIVIDYGFVATLMQLLDQECISIRLIVLKIIGNFAKSYDENLVILLHYNLLERCKLLLISDGIKKLVQNEILNILSSTSGSHQNEIQAIIDLDLIPVIINILQTSDCDSQKFAIWTINNITIRGRLEQIRYIIECDVLTILCQQLSLIKDTEIVYVSSFLYIHTVTVFFPT